jgi:hypothetical protein
MLILSCDRLVKNPVNCRINKVGIFPEVRILLLHLVILGLLLID